MPYGQSFAIAGWASRPSFCRSLWAQGLFHILFLKTGVGPPLRRIIILAFVKAVIPSYLKQRDGQRAPPLVEVNQAILAWSNEKL